MINGKEQQMEMKKGKLWGVGVGPGDSELMTLKSVRLIKECDLIVLPDSKKRNVAFEIAEKAVPEIKEKKILKVHMPMIRDKEQLFQAHRQAAEEISAKLSEGKNLVFLTLGDPTVYSTYCYVHKNVEKLGYECEMVPGVTSFCAAAATLGVSLSEGGEGLYIIPGSYENAEKGLDVPGNKVIMKSGKSIGDVKKILKKRENTIECSMVENCGMDDEKIYKNIDEIDENAGYFSLLIVKEKK